MSQYHDRDIVVTWTGFEEVWRQPTRPHPGANRLSHARQHGKAKGDPRVPKALRGQVAQAESGCVDGYAG